MSPQSPRPKIKLSRLRDIGWSLWDPIGLLPAGETWDKPNIQPFASEYDGYLLNAASQLRAGKPEYEVVRYLVQIETEHMGLGTDHYGAKQKRALAVVAAIQSDKLLWT